LTFGLADEAAAALGATGDMLQGKPNFAQNYDRRVAEHRANLHEAETYHPGAAFAANVAGSLPGSFVSWPKYLAWLNASRGEKMLGTVGRAMRTGAISGALSGGGAAEGGLENRLSGAAWGAAGGGIASGMLPPVGNAIGAGVRRILSRGSGPLYQATKKTLDALGVQTETADRGAQKVLEAFESQGMNPQDAFTQVQDMRQIGKPAVLADVGGENVHGLSDAAMLVPSNARSTTADFLQERAAGMGQRIAGDLSSATNMTRSASAMSEILQEARKKAAAPLYAQAYAAGAAGVTDPQVLGYLNRPSFRKGLREAYAIAKEQGSEIPNLITEDGKITSAPLAVLDKVKQGLDDVIYKGKSQGKLGRERIRVIGQARAEFLDLLDNLFPDYKAARAAYAGPSRMLEAMEDGKNFAYLDTDEIKRLLQTEYQSVPEREHFLLGAVDYLRKAINETPDGADVYRRVFGSPEKRNQLAELFPSPQAFRDFANSMAAEKAMRVTNDTVRGNSRTMFRQVALNDLSQDPWLSLVPHAVSGNIKGLAGQLWNQATAPAKSTVETALPILFGDPRQGLQQLVRARQLVEQRANQKLWSPRSTGTGVGLLLGPTPDVQGNQGRQ
jgi:hypothetical protein